MKAKFSFIAILCMFIFTACSGVRQHVERDIYSDHRKFLAHSLGDYRIQRQRSATRRVVPASRHGLYFLNIYTVEGSEWTLSYTNNLGQRHNFVFCNLHAYSNIHNAFGERPLRFEELLVQHAENVTLYKPAQEFIRVHFSRREIRDFYLRFKIEQINKIDFENSEISGRISNARTGLSIQNLTPEELYRFGEYNIRFFADVSLEDMALLELRPRFEKLFNDIVLHFGSKNASMYFEYESRTVPGDRYFSFASSDISYNAELGTFVWRIHGLTDEEAFTDCGRLAYIRMVYVGGWYSFDGNPGVLWASAFEPKHPGITRWSEEEGDYMICTWSFFPAALRLIRRATRTAVGDEDIFSWTIDDIAYELRMGRISGRVTDDGQQRLLSHGVLTIYNGLYTYELCLLKNRHMTASHFAEITGTTLRLNEITRTLHIE